VAATLDDILTYLEQWALKRKSQARTDGPEVAELAGGEGGEAGSAAQSGANVVGEVAKAGASVVSFLTGGMLSNGEDPDIGDYGNPGGAPKESGPLPDSTHIKLDSAARRSAMKASNFMMEEDFIKLRSLWPRAGARADSVTQPGEFSMSNDAAIRNLQAQIDALARRTPALPSDDQRRADNAECSMAASRYETVALAFGDTSGVPPRVANESALEYRARLASKWQQYSTKFKTSKLDKVGDPSSFAAVEDAIYADAETAADNGVHVPTGKLVARIRKDPMGLSRFKDYVGAPNVCWDQFKLKTAFVKRWGDEKNGQNAFTLN
jgi:hypothetical protein